MLQTTGSNQQELEGGLQNILQEIIQQQVDEMVNEMTAKVNEELKDLLDGAMDTVKEHAGRPGREGVRRARTRTRARRRCWTRSSRSRKGCLAPAEVFIDAIKAAASIVGIDV